MPPGDFGYLEGDHLGKPYDLGLLKRLTPYLRPWRGRWLLIVGLTLGATALDLLPPYLTKLAIDTGILKQDWAALRNLALALLAVLAVAYGLQYTQVVLMEQLGQRVMHALRLDLAAHLLSLPLSFYQHHPVGRLVTRATNDIENLSEMVKSLLATLVKDLIMFLGIAVLLFVLNFRLALVVSAILPVIWIIARLFARRARDAFRELRRWVAQLNAVIQETINGMALIQLLRGEGRRYRVFQDANHQTYLAGMQQIQVFALFMPLMELGSAAVVGLLLWYGGGEILRGTLTLGALVAFLSYTQMFFRPLRELTEKYSVMQSAMASLERIFALMDEGREPDPADPAAPPPSGWSGEIVFDHVHFAYEPDKWVLRDISFTIPPGESVAVVGMTGGGKTTLMHLLAGFYPPGGGTIRIDGRDLQTLSKKELRSIIGLVPQEAFLFAGMLEDNLFPDGASPPGTGSTGRLGAAGLPERLQELFGREVRTLSAGEQQLAALARVMIRNPAILVLDEATAHIDAATEAQVQETLRRLLAGRTSLVIAHRLFTLRQTRRILVLHEGRLVEDGTHEQLMAIKGYYYRLYQLQFAAVNGEGR